MAISKKPNGGLSLHVRDLRNFSTALIALAEQAPERTTVAQMVFFLLAGMADAAGKPSTFTELKDAAGESINRSLHTTYKLFLDQPVRRSDYDSTRPGLGWLSREMDPKDNRRNYLRLTPRGKAVLSDLLSNMNWKG